MRMTLFRLLSPTIGTLASRSSMRLSARSRSTVWYEARTWKWRARRPLSSFGTEEGFAYFLRRSLAMMQMEVPWIYEWMCAEVAGREIVVDVDGDRVILIFHETGARLFEKGGSALAAEQHRRPAVEVSMSRSAILRLI